AAPQADTGGLAGIVADAAARVPLARGLAGHGALLAEPPDPAARQEEEAALAAAGNLRRNRPRSRPAHPAVWRNLPGPLAGDRFRPQVRRPGLPGQPAAHRAGACPPDAWLSARRA